MQLKHQSTIHQKTPKAIEINIICKINRYNKAYCIIRIATMLAIKWEIYSFCEIYKVGDCLV